MLLKFLKLKLQREREMEREFQQITDDERREKTKCEKSGCIYRRNPPSKELAEAERESERERVQKPIMGKKINTRENEI